MNIHRIKDFMSHIDSFGRVLIPQRFKLNVKRPRGNEVQKWFNSYGVDSRLDNNISFSCTATTLPGRSMSTNPVFAPGPEQKYPYQDVFEDLTVTFMCTTGKTEHKGIPERRFMDAWMASVCNPITMEMNYSNEYSTSMELIIYDESNRQLGTYEFHRSYPLAIGPVEFSQGADAAATFEATFNYDRWIYK